MRLVRVDDLVSGARVARDVWTGSATALPLLRAGATLTPAYIRGLRRAGIGAVYIEDELGEGIEPVEVIAEETRRRAARAVERLVSVAALDRAGSQEVPLGDIHEAVDVIVDEILAVPEAVLALADLTTADGYTVQHSIDVAVLGLLIARVFLEEVAPGGAARLDRRQDRDRGRWLRRVGLGLMLHDVGKALLPRSLLMKPEALTDKEWTLVRRHPLLGAEILERSGVGPLALTAVRWHHERLDGSGYPDGLDAESLPLLPRIAAVADVFDAMTSARPYRPAAPSWVATEEITGAAGRLFDAQVVAAFRRVVAPYPVGTLVRLSDGSRGLVAALPPGRPDRPVVRLVPERGRPSREISLLDRDDLTVVPLCEVGGVGGHLLEPLPPGAEPGMAASPGGPAAGRSPDAASPPAMAGEALSGHVGGEVGRLRPVS